MFRLCGKEMIAGWIESGREECQIVVVKEEIYFLFRQIKIVIA